MATQAYSAFAEILMSPPPYDPEKGVRPPASRGLTPFSDLNPSAALHLDHVQPALLLFRAGPAAGPFVVAVGDRLGAGPTTDTGVALVMQRIVRNLVLQDERPHVLLGPCQQGVDLHEVELRVPLNDRRRRTIRCLVTPDAAQPG